MSLNDFLKILLFAVVPLTSCTADENMNIEGRLIYIVRGGNVGAITFSASEYIFSSFYESEGVSAINHLTRENDNALLFDECIRGKCSIKRFSLKTRQVTLLRSGSLPSYISNHDKLFFYDRASDGVSWLFEASLGDIKNATKIAKEPEWKTLPNGIRQSVTTPVIHISNDEVTFVGKDEQLWLYNIANTKLASMNIKGCRPILWMDKRNQLLCSDWDTWDTFFLDLKTKNKEEMPDLKGAYGFVYVPSSDALIYGRTRSRLLVGEAYDIFLYSFADKEEKRIKDNAHFSGGVWIGRATR